SFTPAGISLALSLALTGRFWARQMSCDSVFHQYLQSIAEFWPVRFSLALSLAPASSGFCNSLTNKLFGVGGGGRNRAAHARFSMQEYVISRIKSSNSATARMNHF